MSSTALELPVSESDLGTLSNPRQHVDQIDVQNLEKGELLKMLHDMLLIRVVEEQIAVLVEGKEVRCPCHLAIGQEAVPVGVSSALDRNDRVFGAHRSHGHYLAVGGDPEQLMAEVFGKEAGCSKGMGGSMHLLSQAHGFYGSVPIVGATIPIATGAALALKKDGAGAIAVSYFGDGATEEGVFHESMNLAAIKKLPVLFVCENNLYSSHLDIKLRQPSDRCSRYAEAHRIPFVTLDGNDVVALSVAVKRLVAHMRAGEGPAFIEAITYRHRGHVGPDANIDVGLRRREEDVNAWMGRDPIVRLRESLEAKGYLSKDAFMIIENNLRHVVSLATNKARVAPYPDESALLGRVYPASSTERGDTNNE